MKEQTLIEMSKKVDSLIRVSQKLIQEIQQIDTLARGTITALQMFKEKITLIGAILMYIKKLLVEDIYYKVSRQKKPTCVYQKLFQDVYINLN